MRSESIGFVRHAKLMLSNASLKIGEEWDDPDVNMSPAQTADLRREIVECTKLLQLIEPFAKEFEKVADARTNTTKA